MSSDLKYIYRTLCDFCIKIPNITYKVPRTHRHSFLLHQRDPNTDDGMSPMRKRIEIKFHTKAG